MAASEPYIPKKHFKVLIPTDFSEIARGAIDFVLASFHPKLTHLYLLHAYKEKSPDAAPMVSLIDILREKAERQMQTEVRYVMSSERSKEIEIQSFTRFDGYLHSILDISGAEDIDLVVLGTNGHTHPRLDLREDDPGFVLHKLNRPLLLVPKLLN